MLSTPVSTVRMRRWKQHRPLNHRCSYGVDHTPHCRSRAAAQIHRVMITFLLCSNFESTTRLWQRTNPTSCFAQVSVACLEASLEMCGASRHWATLTCAYIRPIMSLLRPYLIINFMFLGHMGGSDRICRLSKKGKSMNLITNIIKSHRVLCLLHQDCTKTHRKLDTESWQTVAKPTVATHLHYYRNASRNDIIQPQLHQLHGDH